MRVLFSYIAQIHQTFHSLPIALEMAVRHSSVKVYIACATQQHLDYIRSLATLYPEAHIHYCLLKIPNFLRQKIESYGIDAVTKLLILFLNKSFFNRFDAIVVPERTSLYLRKIGVHRPRLIWTRHGAGDRAIGFAKDVCNFDFVLMSGKKVEQRLLKNNSIQPAHYMSGIYAKFDIVLRMKQNQAPLFQNQKPVILYNPHFKKSLSSWPKFGMHILEQFAKQDHYNLIFAPHYRLFDPSSSEQYNRFRSYASLPHILLDLGSLRSIDMTYTLTADFYLGDVSSQVAEFLIQPRPCMFLNAHNVNWKGNPNYQFWLLGQVVSSPQNMLKVIDDGFMLQNNFLQLQKHYIGNTFGNLDNPTASIGADSIINYLRTIVKCS